MSDIEQHKPLAQQVRANPLMRPEVQETFDIDQIDPEGLVMRNERPSPKAQMRELFRKESAADFLGEIRPGMHLFGFSKGQFSLIDLIEAVEKQVTIDELVISTWTAATADLSRLETMIRRQSIQSMRWIIDFSFQRRQPGVIKALRDHYGFDAVRCMKNHAKYLLIRSGPLRLVVRTSMNLNFNPRFEDIDVKDDADLYAFLEGIVSKIFNQTDGRRQSTQLVREHNLEFARLS